jgi:starch phosphorylase
LIAAQRTFDDNALTLGFARRFATYKRAPLIFHDARRLARILGDPKRPVQLVFAGKAHPRDLGGQDFARQIYLHAAEAGFRGRVVLLEDYAMDVGRMLTSGVDVWLNNPIRPQEASGTSGMKPPLHGGLNCSILDGWWAEAYNGKNGFSIGDDRELSDAKQRDRFDSQSVYTLLESEIVPTFYDRDREDIPRRWVRMMIESMKTVCAQFNPHRMVSEYLRLYERPRR